VDIGDGASLKSVDMFCYLGDMLSVDGDADAAVEARVHKGWNKFRQLVPPLTIRLASYEKEIAQLCAYLPLNPNHQPVFHMAVKRGQWRQRMS